LLVIAKQELSSYGLRAETRRIDGQPRVEVELKAAVGVDVGVDQGCDSPSVIGVESGLPGRLGQNLLNHEGVHVDERKLYQVEGEHADFLIVDAVRSHLTAFAKVDEVVGAIPVLDNVKPFVDETMKKGGVVRLLHATGSRCAKC
jgi:hypothetical protein